MSRIILLCCLFVIFCLLTVGLWNQNKDPLEPPETINGLRLEISAVKNKVPLDGDIQVEYRLFNADTCYTIIFSHIFPLAFVSPNLSKNQITFWIQSPDGSICKYSGNPYYPKYAYPNICEYISLGSNCFFGRTISLNKGEFAYSIGKKGKYRIKAVYTTDSKDWLLAHMKKMGLAEADIPFRLTRVFNGTLVSNEIEIEVN